MPVQLVLQFLWDYKAWILAAVLGIVVYIEHLTIGVDVAAKEKAELQVKQLSSALDVSNASIKTLQGSIDNQNTAIDSLKKSSDARLAQAQADLVKAKAASAKHKTNAGTILSQPEPKDKPACDSANDLINKELNRAKN